MKVLPYLLDVAGLALAVTFGYLVWPPLAVAVAAVACFLASWRFTP